MTPLILAFLGIVALVFTGLTLTTADDQTAIISGLLGATTWTLWAYSTLNVTIYSGGSEFTESYPAFAALGLALAAPNAFVALTGPLMLAKNPDAIAEEVR